MNRQSTFDAFIKEWAAPQKAPRTRKQYENTMHELEEWLGKDGLTFESDPQAIANVVKVWKKHLDDASGDAADNHQKNRVSCVRTFYAFLIKRNVPGITTNPIDLL